ncbi:sensor histidine kinase [Levilactobacillus bambusae]|uniref:histidine kinase n=1 Tax=Levilactobacillus bambusae TaxID=2024736 RepID=A0A2V1MX17_9LACO|nr:ATP-binding protein [Levilactobacillus bambusae]PWF99421.1 histidine kinase [Levilactobacillus bambusae]
MIRRWLSFWLSTTGVNAVGVLFLSRLTTLAAGPAVILFCGISLIEGLMSFWWIRATQRKITALTEKARGMADKKSPPHVLLHPHDPFYELAMQLNHLQTEEQGIDRQFQNQSREMTTILANLPVGVMVLDRYRKVELANPAMESLLQEQISNRRHPYTQDIKQFELANLVNVAYTKQTNQRKVIQLRSEPADKRVEARVVYTDDPEGEFQIIVMLYDVSEIYAIERMQMDFVSNASHELKTPVTAISGFAKTLLEGAKDDPETLTKFLTIIDQQSNRLVELINDVLSLSRLESSQTSHPLTTVSVQEAVEEQITVLTGMADLDQVTLENRVPAEIKQQSDPQKLAQILKNLIGNAIKYNRPNGRVTVSYWTDQANWGLIVQDNGIGISSADSQRVFERFYRAETSHSNQVVSGTGLGLAIVSELVESLSGTIQLQSQLGIGTTITLSFPMI